MVAPCCTPAHEPCLWLRVTSGGTKQEPPSPWGSPSPPPCSVAALVAEYGLGDGKRWMANWEKAWQAGFNSCNLNDECVIQLS